MACCRRASGAATGHPRSRQLRPGRIPGGQHRPCPLRSSRRALEGDPAGKAQVLAGQCHDAAGASLGLLPAQHPCARLVRFTGVQQMRRNTPQT